MTMNVTVSGTVCRKLFFFFYHIINSNLKASWQHHICSIAIQSAYASWIFCRRNTRRLHHHRRLWCMTCLTRLINDLSKAHTISKVRVVDTERCKQGERNESEHWIWERNVGAPDGVSDRCDHHWELRYSCDTLTARRVIFQLLFQLHITPTHKRRLEHEWLFNPTGAT